MARRQRDYQAEYARRAARAKTQGTSYGRLRRLDEGARARIYEAQAAADDRYRKSAKAWLPGGRKRPAETVTTGFDGGEHVSTTAGAFRTLLGALNYRNAGPISLAITFQGRRVLVDAMNASEVVGSERLPAGGGKGTVPERRGLRCTGLELWTHSAPGFDILDLIGLVDFFDSAQDALWVLWDRANQSPTMGRDRQGRKRYRDRRRSIAM